MEKLKELRMTLVILVIGTFFISGCFFNNKHTVTFKTNGGSEIKNMSVKSGSKLEKIADPKKEGYIFDGWYLEGEEFDFNSKITDNVTLVAKWVKVEVANADDYQESTSTTEPTTTKQTGTTKPVATSKTTKKTTKKIIAAVVNPIKPNNGGTSTSETNNNLPAEVVVIPNEVSGSNGEQENQNPPVEQQPENSTASTESTNKPDENENPGEENKDPENKDPETPGEENKDPENPTPPTPSPTVPTLPVNPIEVTDLAIEIIPPVVNEETGELTETETIKITKTNIVEKANVISKISKEDFNKIMASDMKNWVVTSGSGHLYKFDFPEGTPQVNLLVLTGDNNVTSLTVQIEGKTYLFEYNDETQKWTLLNTKDAKAQVSTGLDIRYFSNLQSAFKHANKGETITLLSDIEVDETIKIPLPIIFDGSAYKITTNKEYLFDIEEMKYEDGDELIFNQMDLDIRSLIYYGNSSFDKDKIIINASEGNLDGNIFDNGEQPNLNDTNLLYSFR